jgi:hypothetical protein
MKIVIGVVSKAWNKTPTTTDGREKTELSMNGNEESCALCGLTYHKLDKCYNYDNTKGMEENHKIYKAKL